MDLKIAFSGDVSLPARTEDAVGTTCPTFLNHDIVKGSLLVKAITFPNETWDETNVEICLQGESFRKLKIAS